MDITKMTRQQFLELPRLDECFDYIDCDSIVLIPTRRKCDNGWGLFDCVICDNFKPLGRVGIYDVFSIWTNDKSERIGFDLLEKSGLFRIFLQNDKYFASAPLHEIRGNLRC